MSGYPYESPGIAGQNGILADIDSGNAAVAQSGIKKTNPSRQPREPRGSIIMIVATTKLKVSASDAAGMIYNLMPVAGSIGTNGMQAAPA